MMWLRPRLRQWVWLAVLALLGQMALPGLSQARGVATQAPGRGEVCSMQDGRSAWPGAADAVPGGPEGLWHGHSHCPLCAPGAYPWMPPPVAAAWPRRSAGEPVVPACTLAPGMAAPLCLKALPRAPPTPA